MDEVADPAELRRAVLEARCAGRGIGLVPTMGYFHAGHERLMEEARRENELVIVSIFVNPTQFGPSEDFERYPRDLAHDRRLAARRGVDILFVPSMETMYPGGPGAQIVWVDPGKLAAHLEGKARPGHFRGVATVVVKLFNLVAPDRAYFGQKDAQQARVVTRMARDLAFSVEVREVPTVREADGLALSSRNVYLSPDERRRAPAIFAALSTAADMVRAGNRDAHTVEEAALREIRERAPGARVEYLTVSDLITLKPVHGEIGGDVLISTAVFFGHTRLIDNTIVRGQPDGRPATRCGA